MRFAKVIHQQVIQLRWYFFASLGLVMVLPLEEAIINLRYGDGFYSDTFWMMSISFSPLLVGLIACVHVQADLSDKRYIFWRSKPIGSIRFIGSKFIVGLIVAMLVPVIVAAFSITSRIIFGEKINRETIPLLLLFGMMGLMMYSLCFLSNVLVRRTARGWLIGMAAGCFVLILPFMLPLDYKDFLTDMMLFGSLLYPGMMAVVSIVCFVLSLLAAEYDWHLKTNLKGLLWVGGGFVFVLAMLLSSQVANIRILRGKQVEPGWSHVFSKIDGQILFIGRDINYVKDDLSFEKCLASPFRIMRDKWPVKTEGDKKYFSRRYPEYPKHYQMIGGKPYFFNMQGGGWGTNYVTDFEKLTLRSFKYAEGNWEVACELDISDCLKRKDKREGKGQVPAATMAMRYIDNKMLPT